MALVPGSNRAELRELEQTFPKTFHALQTRAAARAERILSDRMVLLGHPVDLRDSVDWHRDPRSLHRSEKTFYGELPLCDLGDGVDVKYVWELGRQQYVVELARGWLLTQKQNYAERARDFVVDWIRENPLYEGIHWTSALEVAVRSISWLWMAFCNSA